MSLGFKSQCVPEYRVLDERQIQRLHCATLELLETVGVKVLHPEALEMLNDFQGYNLAFTGKEQYKGMLINNLSDAGILTGIDGVFVWGLRQNNEVISDNNNNLIKSDFNG